MSPPHNGEASSLFHAVAFYGSDEDFLSTCLPFCEAGIQAGLPTVVGLEASKMQLIRSALDDPGRVLFVAADDHYAHPPGALTAAAELFRRHAAGTGRGLRILGELPRLPEFGLSADPWVRYEAAVNSRFGDLPIQALCAYDTEATAEAVLDEMVRTHHAVATADGRLQPNSRYEPPEVFMTTRREVPPDPLEGRSPGVELADPSPSATRQAVAALAGEVGVAPHATATLLVGVNEALTNAVLHGRPPVLVRAWGEDGRVVVAVRDAGRGPSDPCAGLLSVQPGRQGGRGLWITHQLCAETALSVGDEGFTVRLAAGTPGA